LAKVVKRVVRRGRPAQLVDGTRVRGKEATGLGYLSGHAAVAASLMLAVASAVPRKSRLCAAAAASVGVACMYVGAQLPLDVGSVLAAFPRWRAAAAKRACGGT